MKIELSDEALDELFVQYMKEGLDIIRANRRSVKHPEDISNCAELEGAFITMLRYYMVHTEFNEFIKETYRGSDADS